MDFSNSQAGCCSRHLARPGQRKRESIMPWVDVLTISCRLWLSPWHRVINRKCSLTSQLHQWSMVMLLWSRQWNSTLAKVTLLHQNYSDENQIGLHPYIDDLSRTDISNYSNWSSTKCEHDYNLLVVSIRRCLLPRCRNAFWVYRNANVRWWNANYCRWRTEGRSGQFRPNLTTEL